VPLEADDPVGAAVIDDPPVAVVEVVDALVDDPQALSTAAAIGTIPSIAKPRERSNALVVDPTRIIG